MNHCQHPSAIGTEPDDLHPSELNANDNSQLTTPSEINPLKCV